MCPFCLATMRLVAAGAVSTGGLAALAVKVSRKKTMQQKLFRTRMKGAVRMTTRTIDNPNTVSS